MNFEESKDKDDIYEISELPEGEEIIPKDSLSRHVPPPKDASKEHKKAEKPEHEETKILKNKLKKREAEVKSLKKENEDLLDKYLRAVAEMENLRKRLDREKQDYYQYALSELLRELLLTMDNFERAFKIRDQADGKSFQEGIELIHKQFSDLLRKRSVFPIDTAQKKFDPNLHQAVLTEESDQVEEAMVGEELQKGYMLGDRLLRPSLVKVLIPKKS